MKKTIETLCGIMKSLLKMVSKKLKMVEIEVDISDEDYAVLVLNAKTKGITVDELATRIVRDFVSRRIAQMKESGSVLILNAKKGIANNSHLKEIDLFYIAIEELEKKYGKSSTLKAGMIDVFIAYLKTNGYKVATDKLYKMLYVTEKPENTKK